LGIDDLSASQATVVPGDFIRVIVIDCGIGLQNERQDQGLGFVFWVDNAFGREG
jgi:hypothetical protein